MAVSKPKNLSKLATPSRVWLEVDLEAIGKNFSQIQITVKPAKVMAVLKANAYGLGALAIAKALSTMKVDRFGVAELKEAKQLRQVVFQPVQILGGLLPDEIPEAVKLGVICPITDISLAQHLSQEALRQKKVVTAHVKIDTGMGRMGLPYFEAYESVKKIAKLPGLKLEGIYSHFSNANNPSHHKSLEQQEIFQTLLKQWETDGLTFPLIHMANSDGINNFPGAYFNLVRTGINLYGVFDLQGRRAYKLRPTLALKTRLIARRKLPAGYTIGYGCTHTLFKDTWVGTLPVGYADGIPLAASNSGRILIGGQLCPIIGRVSMDYITVDLTVSPKARVGDIATIVGKQGRVELTIEDWVKIKQTHPYDIICSLGSRVERIYL